MSRFIILTIAAYQKFFSPETGILTISIFGEQKICPFYPSCSEYMKQSVLSHGAAKGIFFGIKRLARCHPFQAPRIDHIK
ncbi:MAG: membrane protein insertion efficiency factor YidD [Patescibacteria group bacterium]